MSTKVLNSFQDLGSLREHFRSDKENIVTEQVTVQSTPVVKANVTRREDTRKNGNNLIQSPVTQANYIGCHENTIVMEFPENKPFRVVKSDGDVYAVVHDIASNVGICPSLQVKQIRSRYPVNIRLLSIPSLSDIYDSETKQMRVAVSKRTIKKKTLCLQLNHIDLWLKSIRDMNTRSEESQTMLNLYRNKFTEFVNNTLNNTVSFIRNTIPSWNNPNKLYGESANTLTELKERDEKLVKDAEQAGETATIEIPETTRRPSSSKVLLDTNTVSSSTISELYDVIREMQAQQKEFQENMMSCISSILSSIASIRDSEVATTTSHLYTLQQFLAINNLTMSQKDMGKISWNCNVFASQQNQHVVYTVNESREIVPLYNVGILVLAIKSVDKKAKINDKFLYEGQ